jgi:hypothetical protein
MLKFTVLEQNFDSIIFILSEPDWNYVEPQTPENPVLIPQLLMAFPQKAALLRFLHHRT